MKKDSRTQLKSFADFQNQLRNFDHVLEELQNSIYDTAHKSQQDFDVYVNAQMVRDSLFRLVRKMRRIPDETNIDDFDCGGGEVLRTRG